MNRQILRWKEIKCPTDRGSTFSYPIPEIVDSYYRGCLLGKILEMPKRAPLTFEEAFLMLDSKHTECFDQRQYGSEPGQFGWYSKNFIEWISSEGYHIELTGDEFEAWDMQHEPS